jgi:excisionase family DNA binding protein
MAHRSRFTTAIAKNSPVRSSGGDRNRIQFFTVTETADMLRVATRTVRRWVASRELVAHRIGRAVRIADRDLRAFLAVHRDS